MGKAKRLRRAYTDGVAAGVAKMMDHFQPEGDGFPRPGEEMT